MKIRKNISMVLCIGAALLLCSCQKTPDTVKQNASKYQKIQNVKKAKLQYVSVGHILDDQEEVLAGSYQNLTFEKTVHIDPPDSISVLSLKVADPFGTKEKLGDICRSFWGTDKYRKKIMRLDDLKEYPKGVGIYAFHYYGDDAKDSARMSDNGYVALYKENSELGTNGQQEICHIDWNEDLDKVYELDGEKIRVRDAVEYVNQWCNDNWKILEPDYNYKVKTVYVCRNKEKGCYFYFDVCKFYQGMPFDDIQFYTNDGKYYIRNSLDVVMEQSQDISFFRNNDNSYELVNDEKHNDKVIGLKQAVMLVQEKMTGRQKFKIADIDLKYVICSDLTKDDLEKKNISSYDFPGNPATARPVWSFILDYEPTKEEKEYNAWPRKFINVDMITGEILYQDLAS